jgi:predicted dehydrogenase
MAEAKLRVAVVGGGIGTAHIKGYQEVADKFDLVAICDIDTAKARSVADEYNIPEAVSSFEALCARPDLDVIDICTPPHLHFKMIKQALEAGKHTICEKPLVSSVEQVDQLKEVQARSGRQMMPIFQYRFGHGLQKLKKLVEEQVSGRAYVATVETAWRRRAAYYDVPWRGKWETENGGAVLGHAIHAHDMLTYILGPVKSVFARTATLVNKIEVEDCASISLAMANGALASLTVTLGSSEEITRHRFSFQNLSAESNTRPYTSSGDPWFFKGDTPEAEAQIAKVLGEFKPLPEGFAGQFYRFYEALKTGGPLPVTLDDARNSLELVTAIYLSAQTGQPVELPLRPGQPGYSGWLEWISAAI